jgi:hypothetical protein
MRLALLLGLYLRPQLGYWAVPGGDEESRCCRILRRLTLKAGDPRSAATDIGHARYCIIEKANLTRQPA